jgi:single-strand DNA-binding protein
MNTGSRHPGAGITVAGNLTSDPLLQTTADGVPVAYFAIASTPRVFDAGTGGWKDGETLLLTASIQGEAAEHVAGSLTEWTRVIATGVLVPRTWETKEGKKRTVIELKVQDIGPSLLHAAAIVIHVRSGPGDTELPARRTGLPERRHTSPDEWFGLDANPDGRIHPSGAGAEEGS